MADHSKPTVTSAYANFVTELDARLDDLALGCDPASTTVTNPAVGTIRWTSSGKKWEKWNGTAWVDLSSGYAISIVGGAVDNSPIGATTPNTGRFTTLETSTQGSPSAPAVRIGAPSSGYYGNGTPGTTGYMVRLSVNGVGYAAYGPGYTLFGDGTPASAVFMYLNGLSCSTATTAFGLYNRIRYVTDGTKNVDIRCGQTTLLLDDDGAARSVNTVYGHRFSVPDLSGLQTGSSIGTFRHQTFEDIPDPRVQSATTLYSGMNAQPGVTRYGLNMAGSAQNYVGGPAIFASGILKKPTRTAVSSGTTTLTVFASALVIDVATTMASRTIELPSTALGDGQEISISTRGAIAALTITAGSASIYGAPTSLPAGGFCTFIYSLAALSWFRKG